MEQQTIIAKLPYSHPFLFVDSLDSVDSDSVRGHYTFKEDLEFYKGHFKEIPVTPGVILTECCAQIGLVCMGIYLINSSDTLNTDSIRIAFTNSEMEFFEAVYPNETVTVTSKKMYFRFNKLKCEVKMHNSKGKLVCKGILAGMFKEVEE